MRLHVFEFEDLSWFPDAVRRGGTDYLRYFLNATRFYDPVVPLLLHLMDKTGQRTVVDLCSGGGGAMERVAKQLAQQSDKPMTVTLTDKFPNVRAYRHLQHSSPGLGFSADPVDATAVPPSLGGLRTMFSAAHHFEPGVLAAIFRDASASRAPIAIFDGGDKNILTILGIALFHPLAFAICTPFFKPFTWSRLFFTYLLPLIPLMTVWDGIVSILRLYSPRELQDIAQHAVPKGYVWETGKLKNKLGMRITYLVGYPVNAVS